MLQVGDKAIDFTLSAADGTEVTLSQFKGKKVVLYFYPKDMTPGCTLQACQLRDNYEVLTGQGVVVLGVSRDDIETHKKFVDKHQLTFPLLSDVDGSVCEKYGVWKEKSMFGKKYMGIERSTFIIDKEGVIAQIYRKVGVTGHFAKVTKALEKI